MNKIKLLSKLQTFFDSDEAKRKKSAAEIAEVLNKLQLKQLHTKKSFYNVQMMSLKKLCFWSLK